MLFAHVVDSGRISLAIEQVVARLHQEVITLKARFADQAGLEEAQQSLLSERKSLAMRSEKTEAFFA